MHAQKSRRDPDRRSRIRRLILLAAWAVFSIAAAALAYYLPWRNLFPAIRIPARAEGEMRVHFLDVGQGDSTILEFPDGACLLVDAGDGSSDHQLKLNRYLRGLKPASLEVVATHVDADHCGGIAPVIETFGATKLWLPAVPSENAVYRNAVAAAEEKGAETEILTRYRAIPGACGAYAVCISPYSLGEDDPNESSAVLYVSYQDVQILLGADIPAARERLLVREYALDETIFDSGSYAVRLDEVDVLRVSHHGSSTSSSEEWLSLLSPDIAVISCGRGNRYAHPASEAVARLAAYVGEIYRTDELGDIVLGVTSDGYTVTAGNESSKRSYL